MTMKSRLDVEKMAGAVAQAIEMATAPLAARVKVLEARPALAYVGTWRSGAIYEPFDCVTHQGSLWIAEGRTTERPGEGKTVWTLAVKRGRVE